MKDYSSVSPSAKSLLLMKGLTTIPFADRLAALMPGPEVFDLDFSNRDFWFWIRVMHVESRYRSIDQLLKQSTDTNVLELSSGYSLRGIDFCTHNEAIHFIDTDLPDVVSTKQHMIDELQAGAGLAGRYELLPLNAMDESAFLEVVSRFGPGPITIINEGLLMYLGLEEKKRLCQSIHQVLKQRGGCWITADIYIKRDAATMAMVPQKSSERSFFEQHNIEENKFDSFEAAAEFFTAQGFELVKEAGPDYASLSSLQHLIKVLPPELVGRNEPPPKIQTTWMLRAV